MKYKLWQYPIIYMWLFHYLIKIKFRIKTLIAWRRNIGILAPGEKVTLDKILSFGHWGAGMMLNGWWN